MFDTLFAAIGRSDTRRQLNALSDHQLRDIGLSRDQIDDVAQAMQAVRPQPAARRRLAARGLSLAPLFRAFRSA